MPNRRNFAVELQADNATPVIHAGFPEIILTPAERVLKKNPDSLIKEQSLARWR